MGPKEGEMKNVYEIMNAEGAFYVLPKEYKKREIMNLSRFGVVIYLYYYDDVEFYASYIKRIPRDIDVLIVSSEKRILTYFENNNLYSHVNTVFKENRGRDVAALLVTAREFVLDHSYIAFLHDKKEKNKYDRGETFE